jgi:lipoyl(octanoyl) transferase
MKLRVIAPEQETEYSYGLLLQEEALRNIVEKGGADILLLLRHRPAITLGYFAKEKNLLMEKEEFRNKGVGIYRTDRGGDVTYHGPGQLICYPVIDMQRKGLRDYKSRLCTSIIEALASYGIESVEGHRRLSGIWVSDEKIAAVGYALRRVRNCRRTTVATTHGFALNVLDEMENFSYINPCGMPGMKLTNMERILGHAIEFTELRKRYVQTFARVFGYDIDEQTRMVQEGNQAQRSGGDEAPDS